jgi:hypothetical protein
LLYAIRASFGERGRVVNGGRELRDGTVLGLGPGVGRLLRGFRVRVVEALEALGDVIRHGEVDSAVYVVPFELDAELQLAGPVRGHLVLRGNHVAKVLGVFLADVLDAEVVDDQAEEDRACFVGE